MYQAKEQLKASLMVLHPFVPSMPPVATLSLWRVGPFTVGFSDNHEDHFAAIDRFGLKLSRAEFVTPFVELATKRMQELRGYRSILAPVLSPLESEIVACIGAERLKGEEIAASVCHQYDGHFKGVLSKLTAYVAAGLSIIPVRPDGSKTPAIRSWKPYQSRQPNGVELAAVAKWAKTLTIRIG
jgi:hypothetical protein